MANPNLQLLSDAAKLLQPILGELVFVGGCATALLITDKVAADVRPTFDVDAIAEITSYAQYTEFSERLRQLGFQEDATSQIAGVWKFRPFGPKVVLEWDMKEVASRRATHG